MALSGNLGFVPLDEVLRLLMRSDQRGAVEVRGEDIRGRVFVGKKGVALATTAEERDLHQHLVNSGYVDDAFLRRVVAGQATFADLLEREGAVIDLLREITVESIYHLNRKGVTFEVTDGATSPYSSPRPFELESILDDARRRADEWAIVHDVIADLDATIRMNREAGDQEEIRINREAWRLLCEIGSGSSVSEMAERLGTTEFWIAKVAADLTERQMLALSGETDTETPAEPVPATVTPPANDAESRPSDSWWVEPEDEAPADDSDLATGIETDGDDEGKGSRFGHFVKSNLTEDGFVPAAEETTEPDADAPREGIAGAEPGVEDDTEAFLEKVFSQLDGDGTTVVEEEGHGLLRRRRLGSVLKEADED